MNTATQSLKQAIDNASLSFSDEINQASKASDEALLKRVEDGESLENIEAELLEDWEALKEQIS